MEINTILSYLVLPGKNVENLPDAMGTTLSLTGGLYAMLSDIFSKSEKECDIPIRFKNKEDGTQYNEVRSLITTFIAQPNFANGVNLANRLSRCTTKIPGLGLLFLMLGVETTTRKLVISRLIDELLFIGGM